MVLKRTAGLAMAAIVGFAACLALPAAAETKRVLVVVGSFTDRADAEMRRARIAHPSMDIVEATVSGTRRYRVVIRPAGREDALNQLAVVRAAGIRDAWLLPWDGPTEMGDTVAERP